jgi:hypothetical protein
LCDALVEYPYLVHITGLENLDDEAARERAAGELEAVRMRNPLYAMKYHVLLSVMYRTQSFRDTLVKELRMLLRQLNNGPHASEPAKSTGLDQDGAVASRL